MTRRIQGEGKHEEGIQPKIRQLGEVLPELNALYHEYDGETQHRDTQESTPGLPAYSYFDAESIGLGMEIDEETGRRAREIIDAHNYKEFRVNFAFAEDLRYRGDINEGMLDGQEKLGIASLTQNHGYWAELIFSRDTLVASRCNDWSCYPTRHRADGSQRRTVCVHEATALFLLQEYLRSHNPGDATNQTGEQLLSMQMNKQVILRHPVNIQLESRSLKIEPYIVQESFAHLYVQFRIGTERLYKVKQIPELLEHFRFHEQMRFGSSTVLMMDRSRLDTRSAQWLDFMERCSGEEQLRQDNYRRERLLRGRGYIDIDDSGRIRDEIALYGARLDQFFALCGGKPVECQVKNPVTGKRSKVMMAMDEDTLDLHFVLSAMTDSRGTYQGVRLSGSFPRLLRGMNHTYMLRENALVRVIGEQNPNVELLEDLAQEGMIDIRIGRNELRRFYRNYLPAVRGVAEVSESDEDHDLTAAYLPPEVSFVCFLDTDDGNVICRPCAVYRNEYYSVLDFHEAIHAVTDPMRDSEAEEELLDFLREYFDHCDAQLRIMFTPREEEAMYRFLEEGLEKLMQLSEVRSTERFRSLRIRKNFHVNVGVSVESGLLDLDVGTTEMDRDELLSILEGYRQKRRFVRLKSGDFLKLDDNEQVAQLTELMDTLRIRPKDFVKGKMHLPAYRALYMDRMLEEAEGVYADRDRSFKRLIKQFKTISDADYEVSPSLQNVLRKYQKAGYRWLRTLADNGFGGILADEMGLGKTLQMISVLLAVYEETPEAKRLPSLIVCPASLVYNWGEELSRFAPQLKTMLVVGSTLHRKELLLQAGDCDVLVTSYDLLKRDIDLYEDMTFRFEVIDEAQYIKNHTTAAAKAVKLISASSRFALTGTPIENRLSELWSIFDYLMPGFLYEYATFRREMEQPIVRYEDEHTQMRLKRMVSPFILRRVKTEVLKDLPDKLEEVRYAGMGEEQQLLYDAQVMKMKQTLQSVDESAFRKDRMQILAQLTRLRQICCDPSLCFENYEGESAKREAAIDLILRAIDGGHRILVFSQFVSMLELLAQDLGEHRIPYFEIIGSTPKQKRLELVKAFNEGDVPVFLISLKAGGTGLNLTGADTVIHYDPWWNIAAQNQATDRTHRIGQKQVVTVYKMIMKGTIEDKILALQTAKKKLAEDILSSESVASTVITKEDLLDILA